MQNGDRPMYVGWCRKTYRILAVHQDYTVVINILLVNSVKDYFGVEPIRAEMFKSWPNDKLQNLAGTLGTRTELIDKCVGTLKAIEPPEVDKFQLELLASKIFL